MEAGSIPAPLSNGSSGWLGSNKTVGGRRQLLLGLGLGLGLGFGLFRWPSATSRLISQPLAFDADQRNISALFVVNAELNPIRIPEVKFAQIAPQMGFRNMLIDAIKATLKDGEIPFDGIGVHIPPHVLFASMIDGVVRSEIPANRTIHGRVVGNEAAIGMGVPPDERTKGLRSHVRNVEAAHAPVTFDQRHNGLLGSRRQKGSG